MQHPSVRALVLSCFDGLQLMSTVMVNMADTGRHMAYIVSVDPNRVPEHFKGIVVLEFFHPAAVAFPKLLVVLMYLHILTNKCERMVAKGLLVFIGATWLSFTVAAMFQCTPFAFNWDKTVASGKCFNIQAFANSSSVPNILSDIAVLILPLRTVWGLKISVGRRIGLLFIFLTGSLGLIASVVRTAVFAETLARAGPLDDSTWNHVALVNWTIIEPGMYLISACALSFKPLFRIFAKVLRLQAFVSQTKSTFRPGKPNTGKRLPLIPADEVTLQTVNGGRFHRLSEDSTSSGGSKKLEVLVTTTVDVKTATGVRLENQRIDEFAKGIGSVV